VTATALDQRRRRASSSLGPASRRTGAALEAELADRLELPTSVCEKPRDRGVAAPFRCRVGEAHAPFLRALLAPDFSGVFWGGLG
jgi:hypothetical protein